LSFSKRILDSYGNGGVSHEQLAKRFRVSVPTVCRELRRLGLLRRGGGRPRIVIDITKQILTRYTTGEMTSQDVALHYGISVDKAIRELRLAGADTSRSTRKKIFFARKLGVDGLQEKALSLYDQGFSLNQIAKKYGVTHEGVRQILIRAGRNRRPPGSCIHVQGADGKPLNLRRFARQLRSLRKLAKITQDQLAELGGVSTATIRNLENGHGQPRWDTLVSLAQALGASPGVFGAAPPVRP
jgi:transcriptional regulator with XRE-family HTH domain